MMLRADIATGRTTLDRLDLLLPGPLPLCLARTYRSDGAPTVFGRGWQHGLDRSLRVEAERLLYSGAGGAELEFAPVPVGMEARHPAGPVLQHHADAYVVFASPLVQEVYPKRPAPDGALPLDRFEDPSGNRIQLSYARGRLAEVIDSTGRRVRFVYDGAQVGQVVLVGAGGQAEPIRSFRYGADGTLVREAGAAGQGTEYAYQDGLLVGVTGPAGLRLFAQYDAQRRCTALWHSDGSSAQHFAYDPLRQVTRAIGLDGRQILYRHVLGRQVLEAVDAGGKSLNFYYDEIDRLVGRSAPCGSVATFQRIDPKARTVVQIDHETRVAEAQCGASGLVESVADAFGNRHVLGYDARYHLERVTSPLGAEWRFERDRQGRVTTIESPEGRYLRLRRTAQDLVVDDAAGTRLRCTIDARGRVVARTERGEDEQRFRYDAEGRLAGVESAAYRLTLDYNGAGLLAHAADSERRVARWQRDAAGRVLALDAGGAGPVRLAYDRAGRVRNVAGPEGTLGFAYDPQNRLVAIEGPGPDVRFDYAEGAVTMRDGDTARTYNFLGDLMETRAPDGTVRRFGYGPSGEVLAVEREGAAGGQTRVFDYDEEGRLVQVTDEALDLAFSYDRDGLLTDVRAGSDERVALSYDGQCRPTTIEMNGATYRLDFAEGARLVGARQSDARVLAVRYDAYGRPAVERNDGAGSALIAQVRGQGLALAVRVGATVVPVWGREGSPAPSLSIGERLVRALAFGPDGLAGPDALPDVAGWTAWCAMLDVLGTEVPCADALAVPWPTLNLFALARGYYDPLYPASLPGTLPRHEPGASADDWVTGSHRTGYLQPHVWRSRSPRPRPRRAEVFVGADAPDADAALGFYRLLCSTDRPGIPTRSALAP